MDEVTEDEESSATGNGTTRRSKDNLRIVAALAAATGDERDRIVEELTLLNLDVARNIARSHRRNEESLADLEQIARLALFKAARSFEAQRGQHFLAYAVVCIRGTLSHYFRDDAWLIRPSRSVQAQHHALRRTGGNLSSRGIAVETCYRPLSLEAPSTAADQALAAIRRDKRDAFDQVELREALRPALAALSPRARTVLHLRFVEDRTQSEIGEILGVSQHHVSRLLTRHLAQLRTALEEVAA